MLDPFGVGRRRLAQPATGDPHAEHPGWPEVTPTVQLPAGPAFPHGAGVRLRPLMREDGPLWRRYRTQDEPYLRPVEPTVPGTWAQAHDHAAWWNHFVHLRQSALSGSIVPMAIEVDGVFAGQLTLGNIQHASIRECWVGYWVHSAFMGGGVATAACGLGVDLAFRRVGMHRVSATYLPENPASGRVLRACGFREEGYLRRNLHIDGQWRDHYFMALVREDFPTTCEQRLRASGRIL